MSKYNTLCIGDYHLKDYNKSPLDTWQVKVYMYSFKSIIKIIEKYNISKLILLGDTFDIIPKDNSLELFAKFMNQLKPYNLEIIGISGNHELLGGQGKNYYLDVMKEYFNLNYNIKVKEYEQIDDILYCSHKHINRLEKLNKKVKIVYSHFRYNIPPITDEIDTIALQKNAELVILGDIHHLNRKGNIVYTSSPTDTSFDSNNDLESHTPSILLLNEETLEWKWETTLSTQYRKKKKIYASVDLFLADVENLRDDFKTNHNFYKCVVQDKKASLSKVKKGLYEDFCIITFEALDLEYNYENKKISNDIVKTLATQDTSKSLLEFCEKNLTKPSLKDKLHKFYHRYESVQDKGE